MADAAPFPPGVEHRSAEQQVNVLSTRLQQCRSIFHISTKCIQAIVGSCLRYSFNKACINQQTH